jgi:hypothetical protein
MRILKGINGNEFGRITPCYILEWVVGDDTLDPEVTTVDSNTVLDRNLIGSDIHVIRGNIHLPGIDPGDGSEYYTKVFKSDTVTFGNPLVDGEYIKIITL